MSASMNSRGMTLSEKAITLNKSPTLLRNLGLYFIH